MNTAAATAEVVYHIVETEVWQGVEATYYPLAFAEEGFVHLSFAHQVLATAQRYYADRSDLTLLAVQVSSLPEALVLENLVGGEELFPHYYGGVPRAAVIDSGPLTLSATGAFSSAVLPHVSD